MKKLFLPLIPVIAFSVAPEVIIPCQSVKAQVEQDSEPFLKHIKNDHYELQVKDLIAHPEYFRRAYLFIHKKKFQGTFETANKGFVSYSFIANFFIDVNRLVNDLLSVEFYYEGNNAEEKKFFNSFNKKFYYTTDRLIDKLNTTRRMEKFCPELNTLFFDALNDYSHWKTTSGRFTPLNFSDFNPESKERVKNSLDDHFEQTIEEESFIPHFFDRQDLRIADEYLERRSVEKNLDLRVLSVKECLNFVDDCMKKDFVYKFYFSNNPASFQDFLENKIGNCTDFGYVGTRLFNLLKSKNQNLINTHFLPIQLHRYDLVDGEQTIQAHMINAVFQSDSREFAFTDLTASYPAEECRTIISK